VFYSTVEALETMIRYKVMELPVGSNAPHFVAVGEELLNRLPLLSPDLPSPAEPSPVSALLLNVH
jgi:hypothetical protein